MANEMTTSKATSLRGTPTQSGTLAILEFQSPSAALIARPMPVMGRVTIWSIFAAVAAFCLIAGVFPIDRVVTATGKVVSQSSNIVVQPLETSIVRQIDVKEGQTVHKGDLLAKLDPTFAAADAVSYREQVESLRSEVTRLGAEASNTRYIPDGSPASEVQASIFASRALEHALKLAGYQQKIAGLQAQVAQAVSDQKSYTQRLEVAKIVEDKRRELERLQVGSQLNTLSALDSRLEIDRGLRDANAQDLNYTAQLKAMIQERDGYVQQYQSDISQQITEQGRKLSDAEDQYNKSSLRKQLVVMSADQDAIILSIAPVSVGSVLQSGDQFITMVPLDAPLEVESEIAGRDSGFVHPGDPANIKFDTFSYALYGYATGKVTDVSPDSFTNPLMDRSKLLKPQQDQDDGGLGPVYYRAHVSLDELKLHDLPSGFRLVPGMSITTDIKVGKRTMLGYMLGRIIPHMSESFREP